MAYAIPMLQSYRRVQGFMSRHCKVLGSVCYYSTMQCLSIERLTSVGAPAKDRTLPSSCTSLEPHVSR